MKLRLLAILLFVPFLGGAQIFSNFSADTTESCAPKRIYFTDLSGGGSIIYRKWDFGNGGISFGTNPSRLYPTPGVYTVSLTVSDGIDTAVSVKTAYIEIFANPTAEFSFSTTANCLPRGVLFTNQSTLGSAGIRTFSWDFGDFSSLNTNESPSHNYTTAGSFSVVLSITDSNSCSSTVSKTNVIDVKVPDVNFTTSSSRADCNPPLTVNFQNTSVQGSGGNTYTWLFGDGTSSSATSPSKTYTTSGLYDVTLIGVDTAGCRDTIVKTDYVTITSTQANADIPDTLCLNALNEFINTSVGANTFAWDFGNGDTSSAEDGQVVYTSTGNYTIRLISSSGAGCIDTLLKTVYVETVSANFTIPSGFSCLSSKTFIANDSSSANAVKWNWYWQSNPPWPSTVFQNGALSGDTTGSIGRMYVRLPNVPARNEMYFDVTLIATTAAGCKDTITKSKALHIFTPYVGITADTLSGCSPLTITFDDTISTFSGYTDYKWDFNRFVGDTSIVQAPHAITYSTPGFYSITLSLKTDSGCTKLVRQAISVGLKPEPAFTFTTDTLCTGDSIVFYNQTIDTLGYNYIWTFSDGLQRSSRNATYFANQNDTGWVDVALRVNHLGCDSTISFDSAFYVSGPKVDYGIQYNACKYNGIVEFVPTRWKGVERFYWDFGTGVIDSTTISPSYNYGAGVDSIAISLTVYNDTYGCSQVFQDTYKIVAVSAAINISDTLGCATFQPFVDGLSSIGVASNRYLWDLGNGKQDFFTPTPDPSNLEYPTPGNYTIRLVIRGAGGCNDTAYQDLTVYDIPVNVSTSPDPLCGSDTVEFVDSTLSLYGVQSRKWYLDGFLIDSIRSFNYFVEYVDTGVKLPAPIYTQKRNLIFEIEDTLNCKRFQSIDIDIRQINSLPVMSDTGLCEGESITFGDSLFIPQFYHIWEYGDGQIDTAGFPTYSYPNPGVFTVIHRIVDTLGCERVDSIYDVSMEHIRSIGFDASLRDSTCYPMATFFSDSSDADNITRWVWDFGDGSLPVFANKGDSNRKIYTGPGIFPVSLRIETGNGCTDSILYQDFIQVTGPYAEYYAIPDTACIGDSILFVIDTMSNVGAFDWDFGDGFFALTGDSLDTIKHSYDVEGNYSAIVLYTDTQGTCNQFRFFDLQINSVRANFFLTSDSVGCSPFEVAFQDSSYRGNFWLWDVGVGIPLQGDSAYHEFENAGTYDIRLQVQNDTTGCIDSASLSIEVLPLPEPFAIPDTIVCFGDTIQLFSFGAETYRWGPESIFLKDTGTTNFAFPDSSMAFTLQGTDSNACEQTVQVGIQVQQIPSLEVSSDTSLIIGERIRLEARSNELVSYRWTPNTQMDCEDCPSPEVQPLDSTEYCVVISDENGCFEVERCILIAIDKKYSLNVPQSFSPNGDGSNERIFVKGWGLDKLLEWRIYNRWGQQVYESADLDEGWDGSYRGEPQNMDTYAYVVRALNFDGEEMVLEGFITLIR